MKLVAKIPLAELRQKSLLRVAYPPFDVCVGLVDGVPHAIEDACNHAGASLAEGSLEGACLTCPMHGYVFSLVSGEVLAPKGSCENQRRFVARIEGDEVVIEDHFQLELRG